MLEFLTILASHLDELKETSQELLEVLNEYQSFLVEGNLAKIEEITPRIDKLAGKVKLLDNSRKQLIEEFFERMGWTGPKNFSSLAKLISSKEISDEEAAAFERVKRSREELIKVLAEVDAQNSLNITLINQAMSFADVSLRMLLGAESGAETYGPKGEENAGPSFLDAQV